MKIVMNRTDRIKFKNILNGNCFMFDNGEVCIKIDISLESKNAFSLSTNNCLTVDPDKYVTELNAEVVIK